MVGFWVGCIGGNTYELGIVANITQSLALPWTLLAVEKKFLEIFFVGMIGSVFKLSHFKRMFATGFICPFPCFVR